MPTAALAPARNRPGSRPGVFTISNLSIKEFVIPTFTHTARFACTAAELYQFHHRPGALERLLPPWDGSELLWKQGGIAPGGKVLIKLRHGPLRINWEAHHISETPGEMFRDIQHRGPFARFEHTHRFIDHGAEAELIDTIEFALPGQHWLPSWFTGQVLASLRQIFTYREHVLREDLLLHQRYSATPLNILISGASGVLGRVLVPLLTTGGHRVWTLVRRPARPGSREIFWDPVNGLLDLDPLPPLDGVIHLAGEYIGLGRWTAEKKQRVVQSRTRGTHLLADTIARLAIKPRAFLSASAVGYYGDCGDRLIDERASAGHDFISAVCSAWEEATAPARQAGIRTVLLRLGIGLTPRGGALQRLLKSHPFFIFRQFGGGDQYISWMSIDDMVAAMLHCLVTPGLEGPVNIAAPQPVTNRELLATLARAAGSRQLFTVPPSLLRLLYGQMADEIVLSGCRVTPEKLETSGFRFRHPDLASALRPLLGRLHPPDTAQGPNR